ncbi:DegT/DnrJ/EryC1/StrS family aminotransferase [Streptomyces cyaneus]|uniref:DegT/DnrJ/EryC1/StrS family aminotransferase n=1 Tax=Streptomyces cyaneus TaxID=1904 RepID=UPI000FF87F33|nr:DegT/DnrJ/EryC1/StrS family aminotransferase [Streptomyces cyaneus]
MGDAIQGSRRLLDVDLLQECLKHTAESDMYILKTATSALEEALVENLPGWRAVGVSGLFGAVLLLALSADAADDAVQGAHLPSQAAAAISAGRRSSALTFDSGAPRPGGRWTLYDCARSELPAAGSPDDSRRHGVVVRELSTVEALADRPLDAIMLDLSGSQELPPAGDMAVLFTRDTALEEHWRALRNHGQPVGRRFHHEYVGVNSRVDEVNARYLLAQLPTAPDRGKRLTELRSRLTQAWTDFGARPAPDLHEGGGVVLTRVSADALAVLTRHSIPVRTLDHGEVLIPVLADLDDTEAESIEHLAGTAKGSGA